MTKTASRVILGRGILLNVLSLAVCKRMQTLSLLIVY